MYGTGYCPSRSSLSSELRPQTFQYSGAPSLNLRYNSPFYWLPIKVVRGYSARQSRIRIGCIPPLWPTPPLQNPEQGQVVSFAPLQRQSSMPATAHTLSSPEG